MSISTRKEIRILAIDPSTRGFGFAVLEGPNRLIDWGVKETKKNKKAKSLKLIDDLIERYRPSVVAVEDYSGGGSRRCVRVEQLIDNIQNLALKRKIKIKSFSRAKVKQAFSQFGGSNKYKIAITIANRFPELAPRLPRLRKPWMSEDYRMSIFDAAALGVASVYEKQLKSPRTSNRVGSNLDLSTYGREMPKPLSGLRLRLDLVPNRFAVAAY